VTGNQVQPQSFSKQPEAVSAADFHQKIPPKPCHNKSNRKKTDPVLISLGFNYSYSVMSLDTCRVKPKKKIAM